MPGRSVYSGKRTEGLAFSRKGSIAFFVFVIFCLLLIVVFLFIVDNNRVKVRQETVTLGSLPKELQGYSLLHVSDLHGQYFGAGQKTVAEALAGADYDAVIITGDLVNDPNAADAGRQNDAVVELAAYFAAQGKPVYYVLGNHDAPETTYNAEGEPVRGELYTRLDEVGAVLLDRVARIGVGSNGYSVWLWPFDQLAITREQAQEELDKLEAVPQPSYSQQMSIAQYRAVLEYYQSASSADILVSATHYPVTQARLDDFERRCEQAEEILSGVDLVVSGHYHGGQICLPVVGAVYVPDTSLGWNGFFPGSDVKGMVDTGGLAQNISGGLGSTRLRFRLFNTPEVSVITFRSEATYK